MLTISTIVNTRFLPTAATTSVQANDQKNRMMIGHPFFGHYGDNDDFGYYGYHNNPRQRQVEARRRAEIERYHRMKALEEQERSRQRQANLRKIRIQQKRQEEERRHRQRRLELERTHLRQAEDGEVPRNGLVRGSDGRIYLVALDQNGRLLQARNMPKSKGVDENLVHRKKNPMSTTERQDGESYDHLFQRAKTAMTKTNAITHEDNYEESVPSDGIPRRSPSLPRISVKTQKPQSKKRTTVVVEAASDSETEDDEFNSIWRNRRPSPGQWMEPVEGF